MSKGCWPGVAVQGRSMCPPWRCGVAVAVARSAALLCIYVISPPWARAALGQGLVAHTHAHTYTHTHHFFSLLFPFPVVHPILSWTGAPLHAPRDHACMNRLTAPPPWREMNDCSVPWVVRGWGSSSPPLLIPRKEPLLPPQSYQRLFSAPCSCTERFLLVPSPPR